MDASWAAPLCCCPVLAGILRGICAGGATLFWVCFDFAQRYLVARGKEQFVNCFRIRLSNCSNHRSTTEVIAVPASLAREHNLRTMEDFARFVRDGNRVRLAASAEFVESAAGLPAFEASYGPG